MRFANVELAGFDAGVVHTKYHVDILHALGPDVCKLFDLGGSVLDLRGERDK